MKLRALLVSVAIAFSVSVAARLASAESEELGNKKSRVKNVILLVGDGMGPQQIGLLLLFKKHFPELPLTLKNSGASFANVGLESAMTNGEVGIVLSEPYGTLVADSACAATQLATGKSCRPEVLGFDENGEKQPTIVELASKAGLATGLVTDTRVTHATPAAFVAHVYHRDEENEVAEQIVASNVSVLFGGGLRHFVPASVSDKGSVAAHQLTQRTAGKVTSLASKRSDERNLLEEATKLGYALTFDRKSLKESTATKLLGLFAVSGMPDAIAVHQSMKNPEYLIPSLREMTEKALSVLSADPQGFFLMVEAGQIDWAAHQNDAGRLLHEMLVIDEVAGYLLDWVQARDDTLLLITADHETGSFGISYNDEQVPEPMALPGFQDQKYAPEHNFISPEVLHKLFRQKKSFDRIFKDFLTLPRTPQALLRLVNENTEFPITLSDARRLLGETKGPFGFLGFSARDERPEPPSSDLSAFYPDFSDRRPAVLSSIVSERTGIVWGTGTHTTTPVLVIAVGPAEIEKQFDGLHTMQELGQHMQRLLGLSN